MKKYAPCSKDINCSVYVKPIRGLDGLAQDYTDEEQDFIKNFKQTQKNGNDLKGIPTYLVIDGVSQSYSMVWSLYQKIYIALKDGNVLGKSSD